MFTQFKQAGVLSIMALSAVFGATAANTVIDGLEYTFKGSEATVAKPSTPYSGDLVIPATVEYNGTTYNVSALNASAFKATAAKPNTTITSITFAENSPITTLGRGQFQYCTAMTKLVLPKGITKVTQDTWGGCSALEELEIPGGIEKLGANDLQGCSSLKKLVFAAGDGAITVGANIWGGDKANERAIEELVLNRVLTANATGPNDLPFTGTTALKKATFGDAWTAIPDYYLQNCSAMTEVVLPAGLTTIGAQAFLNTGITSITIPAGVTSIATSTFNGCKNLTKVELSAATTSIGDLAFNNAPVAEINIPATLTSIGSYAFNGSNLQGAIALPEGLTKIGVQAFAENKGLTAISLPSTLASLGSAPFKGDVALAQISLAANEKFALSANGALTSADGKLLIAYPAAAAATEVTENAEELDNYAFYGAKNLTKVNLPNIATYGDFSLAATGLIDHALAGNIGRSVLADCKNLKSVKVASDNVPIAVCSGCTALESYTALEPVTIVRQDAFKKCAALKEVNLGNVCVIIEAGAFDGVDGLNITISSALAPALAQNVFVEGAPITVTVPVDRVDEYKSAPQWCNLEIKGDANLAVGPTDMGMPAGLYYSGDDDQLHCVYADGETDVYEVDMPHTFQLAQFKNRIYGASAGKKFIYSGTAGSEGDGKLYYISQIAGKLFQATVLDNAGNNAYLDPFALYIYGEDLFVNDRNVALRKIPADAIALPQDYESFTENNWFGTYNTNFVYGCIKAGFSITRDKDENGNDEPLYWQGFKYNGNGIFRFKNKHIGTAQAPGPDTQSEYPYIFKAVSPIFTTFYIDEENRHLYIYLETQLAKASDLKAGIYRFDLDRVIGTPDPVKMSDLDPVLIDGAPVKWEGGGASEHVGISQFSPDENKDYLYWCYRAATENDIAKMEQSKEAGDAATTGRYEWAEAYDAENPLHHSGIKRIKLGGSEKPEVEMVVPGVEGYGVIPVKYEGSKKPGGVSDLVADNGKVAYDRMLVAENSFMVTETAQVNVYGANGQLVKAQTVVADQVVELGGKGVYMIQAIFADGAKQVAKVVVK